MRDADRGDAEMILKLYDLRRETEMRKARKFVFDYEVNTIEDVKAIVSWSHPENAHFRQVTSYWGSAPATLRGLGAQWVWHQSCTSLGNSFYRLNFSLP